MHENIVVTGGGGFIGGHLVKSLRDDGYKVVAADIKGPSDWYQVHDGVENRFYNDIADDDIAQELFRGSDYIYHLAADMGGMGYISSHRVNTMHSVDITSNVLRYGLKAGVEGVFYSSSACVYNNDKQNETSVSLKESDAWPANPEPAYGLEKLYGEEFLRFYKEEHDLNISIARYHNCYGPYGTYDGGREKAPAAICRKVIKALLSGKHEIEIWGDGEQTRSFMYIDDCVYGTKLISASHVDYPINLGSSDLVSINELVSIAEDIAGIKLERSYDLTKPQGVRGRNSDNSLILEELDWEPSTSLIDGMEKTYQWIFDQMAGPRK